MSRARLRALLVLTLGLCLASSAAERATGGDLELARAVLRQAAALIPQTEEYDAARTLATIVLWQARAGDAEAALANTLRIKDESERESARYFAASGLARAGQADLARQLAREAEEDRHDMSLTSVAESLVERGDFEAAVETALEISDPTPRATSLCSIAFAQVKAGKKEEALATLGRVEKLALELAGDDRRQALQCFAYGQMEAGRLDEALKTVQLFESDFIRAGVLRDLGAALAEQGRREEAGVVFDRAVQAARAGAEETWWELTSAGSLRGIPGALVRAGYTKKSMEVVQLLEPGRGQAEGLAQVVVALAAQGNVEQAQQVAAMIEARFGQGAPLGDYPPGSYGARNIPYWVHLTHYDSISPWRAVAEGWARKAAFDQALEIAERIEYPEERVRALRTIAEEQGKTGEAEGAQRTLRSALQFVRTQGRGYEWLVMMTDVALEQAKHGDAAGASATFSEALEFSSALQGKDGSGMDRSDYLSVVADKQAQSGDWRGARQTAALFRDDQRTSRTMIQGLCQLQAKAGDVSAALAWAEQEKEPLAKAAALLGVAEGILERLNEEGKAGSKPAR